MSFEQNAAGTKPERVLTSSSIAKTIIIELNKFADDASKDGGSKHAVLCDILVQYAKARSSGTVPGLHIGVRPGDHAQMSFYVAKETKQYIGAISQHDGVSVSTVIRTAVCWFLSGNRRKKDFCDSNRVLGEMPKFEF